MKIVLQACFIMHNMAVERRREFYIGEGAEGFRDFPRQEDCEKNENSVFKHLEFGISPLFDLMLHTAQVAHDVLSITNQMQLVAALVQQI